MIVYELPEGVELPWRSRVLLAISTVLRRAALRSLRANGARIYRHSKPTLARPAMDIAAWLRWECESAPPAGAASKKPRW